MTMFDDRTNLSQQVAANLREFFRERSLKTSIPRNIRLAEAPSMASLSRSMIPGRGGPRLIGSWRWSSFGEMGWRAPRTQATQRSQEAGGRTEGSVLAVFQMILGRTEMTQQMNPKGELLDEDWRRCCRRGKRRCSVRASPPIEPAGQPLELPLI